MVNESTSENIVLQGYISNANLTNFDFDNTSETIFNSLSALRSTIYSTAIEAAEYPFICTTNLLETLDEASLRRFTFKIRFDFLTQKQANIAMDYSIIKYSLRSR